MGWLLLIFRLFVIITILPKTRSIRGGRRLLSSPHPHPSQVPPAAQVGGGGCKPALWTAGQETRIGHWSAVSRRAEDFWRTDDEGTDAAVGGAAEYAFMDEEDAKRTKGERRRECSVRQEPGWILEGEKRKGPKPSRTGIHRNLNIGTESRETQADVRGTGNNHPIMDKLGVPEAGPKERQGVLGQLTQDSQHEIPLR